MKMAGVMFVSLTMTDNFKEHRIEAIIKNIELISLALKQQLDDDSHFMSKFISGNDSHGSIVMI